MIAYVKSTSRNPSSFENTILLEPINLGQFIQKILELAELHDLNASDIVASEVQPCTLTFFISDGSSDRDRSLLQSSNLRCLNLGR